MGPARLSSALLARKGQAIPAGGAYGGTMLEPIAGLFGRGMIRPEPRAEHGAANETQTAAERAAGASAPATGTAPASSGATAAQHATGRREGPADATRLSLRLDAEHMARLRILAARRGRRPQQLLREALEVVFAASSDDCPCVRGETEACCRDAPDQGSKR